jgi:hypothetical protein
LQRTFDSKLESWKAGPVKMTFDLPEDLLRAAKVRAVHEGKTFKALMAELFRNGLAAIKEEEAKARKSRETIAAK